MTGSEDVDVDAVARGAADDAGGLDPGLLGDFLPTVAEAAASGRRLRTGELERYAERGAAAAVQGVALRALIDLYLSASWRLWRELPVVQAGSAEQVRAAGLAVLRAADDGVAAVAEGFQLARGDLSRRQESARREVFDALLAGRGEAVAVLGRAADLGVDLGAPHAVLVASGNFWVWSVTHEDVKAALAGAASTDLDSPLVTFNRHDGSNAPPLLPRATQGAFSHQAVKQLLEWLASPPGSTGTTDAAVIQMQRNALWLGYLMVPSTAADLVLVKNEMAGWMQQLPLWMQSPGNSHVPSLARADSQPMLVSWWPLACAGGVLEALTAPGMLVLDDLGGLDEEALHLCWRRWLQLFNTLQSLPGMVMTTVSGIKAADCEMLKPVSAQPAAPVSLATQGATSQEWLDLLDLTLNSLRPGLRQLAEGGASPPVVGHELADAGGVVVAEAELAWLSHHVVVLTFEQDDLADIWSKSGWRVLVLDKGASTVAGVAWGDAVSVMLGTKNPEKGFSQVF